jgi:hypothetical protein
MGAQQLREAILTLVPSRRPSHVAVFAGISRSYATRLLSGDTPVTDNLLRRLRDKAPELRPLCDALLLKGGDRYIGPNGSRLRGSEREVAEVLSS